MLQKKTMQRGPWERNLTSIFHYPKIKLTADQKILHNLNLIKGDKLISCPTPYSLPLPCPCQKNICTSLRPSRHHIWYLVSVQHVNTVLEFLQNCLTASRGSFRGSQMKRRALILISVQKTMTIDHFAVLCTVMMTWALNGTEAGGDIALI